MIQDRRESKTIPTAVDNTGNNDVDWERENF